MEEQNSNLSFDEIDEAEASAYKNVFVFDKANGESIEIEINTDKELEVADNKLSNIEKILQELVERNDIKSITVSINVDNNVQVYKSNDELGISIKLEKLLRDLKIL